MNKGYVLVDYPTQCRLCDLCHEEDYDGSYKIHGDMLCGASGCIVNSYYFNKTKPKWCPVKEFATHGYEEDVKSKLEEMKKEEGYVSVSDLAERFEGIDKYYEHSPWNLLQILSNINMFVPLKKEKILNYKNNLSDEEKCVEHSQSRGLKDIKENLMSKCIKCVTEDKGMCEKCKDNPKYRNYPEYSYFAEYIPVCPQGYTDCVLDPAYIKHYNPDWYKELYGELTPNEAARQDCDIENEYCYDDEDK